MAAHAGAQALSRKWWNAGRPQLRLLLSSGCNCGKLAGHDLFFCGPMSVGRSCDICSCRNKVGRESSLADEMRDEHPLLNPQ